MYLTEICSWQATTYPALVSVQALMFSIHLAPKIKSTASCTFAEWQSGFDLEAISAFQHSLISYYPSSFFPEHRSGPLISWLKHVTLLSDNETQLPSLIRLLILCITIRKRPVKLCLITIWDSLKYFVVRLQLESMWFSKPIPKYRTLKREYNLI